METNDFKTKELSGGNDDASIEELYSYFNSKAQCKNGPFNKNASELSYKENDIVQAGEIESTPSLRQEKRSIEFKEKEIIQPSNVVTSYTLKNRRNYKYEKDIH